MCGRRAVYEENGLTQLVGKNVTVRPIQKIPCFPLSDSKCGTYPRYNTRKYQTSFSPIFMHLSCSERSNRKTCILGEKTALEIARSLVVGYIEEEDDLDSSSEDDGTTYIDYSSSAYSKGMYHPRKSTSSVFKNDNNETLKGTVYSSSSTFFNRNQLAPSGRLASQPSDDAAPDRLRARSNPSIDKYPRAYGGVCDEFSNSSEVRKCRSKSYEQNPRTTQAVNRVVGPKVKLSAKAEAILNAGSPPPAGAPAVGEYAPTILEQDDGNRTMSATVCQDPKATATAKEPTKVNDIKEKDKATAASAVSTMAADILTPDFEDDYMLSGEPDSHSLRSTRKTKARLRIRGPVSIIGEKPVALAEPLAAYGGHYGLPEVRCW